MLAKNSIEYIDEVANELGVERNVVNDIIRFFYNQLRVTLSDFKSTSLVVCNIGKFSTTRQRLINEKKRFLGPCAEGNKIAERDVAILNDAIYEHNKIAIDYYENKLAKLRWHKEHGDPYKKYSEEQEKNCKGILELLTEENQRRGSFKKKDEPVQQVREE